MRMLSQSEIMQLNGGKQTLTRAPDWMWGAVFGAAIGWYCSKSVYGVFAGAVFGSTVLHYFAVESPGLVVSKKIGKNLSLSSH